MSLNSEETVAAAAELIQALPDHLTPIDAIFVIASALGITFQATIAEGAIARGKTQHVFDMACAIVEEFACLPVECSAS